ncbi:MAG: hypothetical protein IPK04_18590 [Bdellovibrionales bacterium]|nr:hypothetical protein [Bdellovibrionales bacterium]
MNWEFIVQKISETSWHIAVMISVVSLFKLGILQWTAVKIASIKVSRIEIKKNERTASFSHPEEKDRVVQILKNNDDLDLSDDFYDKAS